MTKFLEVWSDVDPRDLGINIRFKGSQRITDRVRGAQDHLITDIKLAIPDDYIPCPEECSVRMTFVFPDKGNDIDGPIKRTLDALEKAMKAKGYEWWHDGKIDSLYIKRQKIDPRTRPTPGIFISMI